MCRPVIRGTMETVFSHYSSSPFNFKTLQYEVRSLKCCSDLNATVIMVKYCDRL